MTKHSHTSEHPKNEGHLRDKASFGDKFEDYEGRLDELRSNIQDRGKEAIRKFGRNVKKNPWMFIGGTALAALTLGFIAGRTVFKDSDSDEETD